MTISDTTVKKNNIMASKKIEL